MRTALALWLLAAAQAPGLGSDVVALLQKQAAAWNAGDLEGFCSIYADDAVFLSPTGISRGRAEVLARYKKRYPDAAARGTLTIEPLDVRESGGTVSVGARWTIRRKDETLTGMTLVVLHRTLAGYQIVQDASM